MVSRAPFLEAGLAVSKETQLVVDNLLTRNSWTSRHLLAAHEQGQLLCQLLKDLPYFRQPGHSGHRVCYCMFQLLLHVLHITDNYPVWSRALCLRKIDPRERLHRQLDMCE